LCNHAIQSYSSVVYLGHNVFETHKTFDFLHHPTSKQPQQDVRPFESNFVDQATQHVIDSDIVRWATGIPDRLPLTLVAFATILPGPPDGEPPVTEYPLMALLAIFQCPERRLTEEGIFSTFIECFPWFRTRREDVVWKVRTAIVGIAADLP
jgi:hypothetical protein